MRWAPGRVLARPQDWPALWTDALSRKKPDCYSFVFHSPPSSSDLSFMIFTSTQKSPVFLSPNLNPQHGLVTSSLWPAFDSDAQPWPHQLKRRQGALGGTVSLRRRGILRDMFLPGLQEQSLVLISTRGHSSSLAKPSGTLYIPTFFSKHSPFFTGV